MKKTLTNIALSAVFILLTGASYGQNYKVIESSDKKMPAWVHSIEKGYITATAESGDIEAAKSECMRIVRTHIVQAIAENVNVRETSTTSQTIGGSSSDFVSEFTSYYESQSAQMPFLKGISISQVEDTYWEKRSQKKTKEVSYFYAVKYPLSSAKLLRLVDEYQQYDNAMYGKYLELKAAYGSVASVEEIDRAISDLNPLLEYFFDNARKNEVKTLQDNYRKLYSNIGFRTVSNKPGEYVFALTLAGRDITTSARASLSSQDAGELQINRRGDLYYVTYDYTGSEYGREHSVTVRYNFGGKTVSHKFYYTVSKHKVEINPDKTAFLTAASVGEGSLKDISVRVNFVTPYRQFTVKGLLLEVPGIDRPLIMENMDITLTGANVTLQVTYEGDFFTRKSLDGKLNILKATMEVEVPELGGGREKIYFNLTFRPNW